MSSMPADVRDRCLKLRMRSKRGEWISPQELNFLESCWQQWPEDYKAIGREAFIETAPFGSRVGKGESVTRERKQ
jgi:hypothetical protein